MRPMRHLFTRTVNWSGWSEQGRREVMVAEPSVGISLGSGFRVRYFVLEYWGLMGALYGMK